MTEITYAGQKIRSRVADALTLRRALSMAERVGIQPAAAVTGIGYHTLYSIIQRLGLSTPRTSNKAITYNGRQVRMRSGRNERAVRRALAIAERKGMRAALRHADASRTTLRYWCIQAGVYEKAVEAKKEVTA